MRILLIDDEETEEQFFKRNFPEYTFIYSSSIKRALKILENDSFDLILLDNGLGDENGIESLPYIKAKCGNTKIIIYTNQMYEGMTEEAISRGALDVCKKNTFGEELLPEMLNDISCYG